MAASRCRSSKARPASCAATPASRLRRSVTRRVSRPWSSRAIPCRFASSWWYASGAMTFRYGVCAVALLAAACSPKQMALNRMAAALADSTSVYERDNDPEFVRIAAPSTLKTVEMLLSQAPRHPQLLLTACSGFTEYSYGFLHVEIGRAHV